VRSKSKQITNVRKKIKKNNITTTTKLPDNTVEEKIHAKREQKQVFEVIFNDFINIKDKTVVLPLLMF